MWKVELHCHSNASRCSNLSPDAIIANCHKKNIQAIAVTDHNSIQGAMRLEKKSKGKLRVIMGSEILTKEGEITGYFLSKDIPPMLSIADAIRKIKEQKGIVGIPHAGDAHRKKAVSLKIVKENIKNIDCLEVFNSRTLSKQHNEKIRRLAENLRIPQYVGSDAHFACEIGKSYVVMKPWNSPDEFLDNLKNANLCPHKSFPIVHAYTFIHKRIPLLF